MIKEILDHNVYKWTTRENIGHQGVKGKTVATGPQGNSGAQRVKGDTGSQGSKADVGPQGIKGPRGLKDAQV